MADFKKKNSCKLTTVRSVFAIYSADLSERCCRCPEGDIYLKNQGTLTVSCNGYSKIEILVFATYFKSAA